HTREHERGRHAVARGVAHRERELAPARLDEVVVVAAHGRGRQRRGGAVERREHRRPPRQAALLHGLRDAHLARERAAAARLAPELEVLEPDREELRELLEAARFLAREPRAREATSE